jgi:hypothetical protein
MEVFTRAAALAGQLKYDIHVTFSSRRHQPSAEAVDQPPVVDFQLRLEPRRNLVNRVAQEVVRRYLEPRLEPVFHADSYGYRPGKSAIDAVRQARQRCWRYDWVLDIDVNAYFDSIDWELMLRAVRHHTSCPWVLLYIERWLRAPVQLEDGSVVLRTSGTPQGGVVSPVLANLFPHYGASGEAWRFQQAKFPPRRLSALYARSVV